MIDYNHSLLIILVAAAVTFLIRALPFILFRGSTPASVVYLSNVSLLPLRYNGYAGGVLPEVHSGAGIASRPAGNDTRFLLMIVLRKWKHNTLLSIVSGTVVYMLLIQLVFA